MSQPVPLVLGRFIIHPTPTPPPPHPFLIPSASPFCVSGTERDMSMNPPPLSIHVTSVAANSPQWPNLFGENHG